MRKPPEVSDAQMRAALARIRERHADDDNPHTYLLSDDPDEVLFYLQKRGVRELRGDHDQHDVYDAGVLRIWLWWRGERRDVWIVEAGETLKLPREKVGAAFGVTSSQGLMNRLKYKRGLVTAETVEADRPQSARARWLAEHRDQLAAAAETLVAHWDLVDEATAEEALVDVRLALREGVCTHSSFTAIGWAVEEVAVDPAVAELPADHALRRALDAWPVLAAGYPPADSS